MSEFKINESLIGKDKVYIIAEVGQAHEGSLGAAHAYIEAIADTGVDAVKFQTHIASEESTKHEEFRVKVFPQDETRYDYWKRMEFTEEQWLGLAEHARALGLDFISTPFSKAAVSLLEKLSVPAYKIGSGDINNEELLEAIIETKKPILLSSGMSNYQELDEAVSRIADAGLPYGIFQCTTSYPCLPQDVGYNIVLDMMRRYSCPIGLSDHSGTIYPSIASVALGAKILEVHVVFSKHCFGPDTKSSLTIEELKQLVEGVRFIEQGLTAEVDKAEAANKRIDTKVLFSRSAFYNHSMTVGDVLKSGDFSMKKPGGGLSYSEVKKLIGKTLIESKVRDDFVKVDDFK